MRKTLLIILLFAISITLTACACPFCPELDENGNVIKCNDEHGKCKMEDHEVN